MPMMQSGAFIPPGQMGGGTAPMPGKSLPQIPQPPQANLDAASPAGVGVGGAATTEAAQVALPQEAQQQIPPTGVGQGIATVEGGPLDQPMVGMSPETGMADEPMQPETGGEGMGLAEDLMDQQGGGQEMGMAEDPMQPQGGEQPAQGDPQGGGQPIQGWQPNSQGQQLYADGMGPVTEQVGQYMPKVAAAPAGLLTSGFSLHPEHRGTSAPRRQRGAGGLLAMKMAFDPMASVDLARKAEIAGEDRQDTDQDGVLDRFEEHPVQASFMESPKPPRTDKIAGLLGNAGANAAATSGVQSSLEAPIPTPAVATSIAAPPVAAPDVSPVKTVKVEPTAVTNPYGPGGAKTVGSPGSVPATTAATTPATPKPAALPTVLTPTPKVAAAKQSSLLKFNAGLRRSATGEGGFTPKEVPWSLQGSEAWPDKSMYWGRSKDSILPPQGVTKTKISAETASDTLVVSKVGHCARCHEDHFDVEFTKLAHPTEEGGYTHTASCPTNGEPILLKQSYPNAGNGQKTDTTYDSNFLSLMDVPPMSDTCRAFLLKAAGLATSREEFTLMVKDACALDPMIADDLAPLTKAAAWGWLSGLGRGIAGTAKWFKGLAGKGKGVAGRGTGAAVRGVGTAVKSVPSVGKAVGKATKAPVLIKPKPAGLGYPPVQRLGPSPKPSGLYKEMPDSLLKFIKSKPPGTRPPTAKSILSLKAKPSVPKAKRPIPKAKPPIPKAKPPIPKTTAEQAGAGVKTRMGNMASAGRQTAAGVGKGTPNPFRIGLGQTAKDVMGAGWRNTGGRVPGLGSVGRGAWWLAKNPGMGSLWGGGFGAGADFVNEGLMGNDPKNLAMWGAILGGGARTPLLRQLLLRGGRRPGWLGTKALQTTRALSQPFKGPLMHRPKFLGGKGAPVSTSGTLNPLRSAGARQLARPLQQADVGLASAAAVYRLGQGATAMDVEDAGGWLKKRVAEIEELAKTDPVAADVLRKQTQVEVDERAENAPPVDYQNKSTRKFFWDEYRGFRTTMETGQIDGIKKEYGSTIERLVGEPIPDEVTTPAQLKAWFESKGDAPAGDIAKTFTLMGNLLSPSAKMDLAKKGLTPDAIQKALKDGGIPGLNKYLASKATEHAAKVGPGEQGLLSQLLGLIGFGDSAFGQWLASFSPMQQGFLAASLGAFILGMIGMLSGSKGMGMLGIGGGLLMGLAGLKGPRDMAGYQKMVGMEPEDETPLDLVHAEDKAKADSAVVPGEVK